MDRDLRGICLAAGIRTFGAALYSPFLALFLQATLGVGYFAIGLIIFGVGAVQLPFGYVGGLLTDRIGRRPLIILGLVGEAALTALLAYAFEIRSLPGAIAAALVGGILVTIAGPAVSAYIADLASGSARTVAFTWFRIGFNAGFAAGAALGGLLTAAFGFAPAVAAGAAIIGGGAVFFVLTVAPSPFDVRRAARPGTAPDPAHPPRPTVSMGASLRLLVRDRVALELLVAFALVSLVAGQWAVTFPLFTHNGLGVSYAVLGFGLALNGIVVVVGQRPTTQAVLGWRHTTIAALGLALYAVAFVGLAAAGVYEIAPVALFFVAVVVLSVGENLIAIPQSTLPSNLAPAAEVGSYNGAFGTIGNLGFLVSVVLGGWALATVHDPLVLWGILVAPAIPAAWLLHDSAARMGRDANRA